MRPPTVSATVRQYPTPALRPNWPRFDTRGVGGEFCGPNVSGTILSGTSLPSAEGGADEWTRYLDNAFTRGGGNKTASKRWARLGGGGT
jgi:hypothetical protein